MHCAKPLRKLSAPPASLFLVETLESRLLLSAAASVVEAHQNGEAPLPTAPMTSSPSTSNQGLPQLNGAGTVSPSSSLGALHTGTVIAAASAVAQTSDQSNGTVTTPPVGSKQPVITLAEVSSEKAAVAAVQIRPSAPQAIAPPNPVSVPPPVIAAQQSDQLIDPGTAFESALRYQQTPSWQKTFLIGPGPDESITNMLVQYKRLRISL